MEVVLVVVTVWVLCRRGSTEKSVAGEWGAVSPRVDCQHHCITTVHGSVTWLSHQSARLLFVCLSVCLSQSRDFHISQPVSYLSICLWCLVILLLGIWRAALDRHSTQESASCQSVDDFIDDCCQLLYLRDCGSWKFKSCFTCCCSFVYTIMNVVFSCFFLISCCRRHIAVYI